MSDSCRCALPLSWQNANGNKGSAVLVRLIELRTYALRRIADQRRRQCATALENEHLRPAVGLWRLYFENGRWRGDFLAAGMTASGRDRRQRTSGDRHHQFG